MPGTQADAEKAYRAYHDGIRTTEIENISKDQPCGSGRTVYRIGDVVYKTDAYGDNAREYACFMFFQHETWSSEVSLYDVDGMNILCMPFYPDTGWIPEITLRQVKHAWLRWAHMQNGGDYADADFHPGNIRVD
jgi:hypothetical protein